MAEIDFNVPCWYTCITQRPDYDCRKICHRYLHMNYFIMNCGMPKAERYLKPLIAPETDKEAFARLEELKADIESFVKDGKSLYIYSPNIESGKTTWSLKLMYKYFDEIWAGSDFRARGYFVYVPEFLQKMKLNDFKNSIEFKEIDNNLKTADVVIWDDITTKKLSEYDQGILNDYITKRIQDGLSNIFNGLLPDSFETQVGKILTSRLNKSEKVKLLGQ